jgi:mannose-1-phosphate guanylyltransferase
MYALILAGGCGTRLWPYSRNRQPKQFLRLGGERTMLQAAVERVRAIIPAEHVFVATGATYADMVAEQLPGVPGENILVEPSGRGTAPCIGLAALYLRRRDPDAVMVVLSADHWIDDVDRLCAALTSGAELARQGHLVILGIQPSAPSTAYGYIRCGAALERAGELEAYQVEAFVEKPDERRARAYFASGDYLWNAGMFVWRADRILEELALHQPALSRALLAIDSAGGARGQRSAIEAAWGTIEAAAIDVAVMERTNRTVAIPCDLGWKDVGDWSALADTLPVDEYGNAVVGTHIHLNTYDSLIYGGRRVVATVGVTELLIVDTEDVLLICSRGRAQDVKAIVAQVREQHQGLL